MHFSKHALRRFNERLEGSLPDIESQLQWLLVNKKYNRKPVWYHGPIGIFWKESNVRWLLFKDADGVEAAALVNIDQANVITFVKKGIQ